MDQNPPTTSSTDEKLAKIISAASIATIDDVIAVMHSFDDQLQNDDGLKWFNLLYLRVTEGVREDPPAEGFEDQRWLEKLDVVFAKLYFDAVAGWQRKPTDVARAWSPLFNARQRDHIARVQFALAGMNAHINHDCR